MSRPCHRCGKVFSFQAALNRHLTTCRKRKQPGETPGHFKRARPGRSLAIDPLKPPSEILEAARTFDPDLAELISQRWVSIRTHQRLGHVQSLYNVRIEHSSMSHVMVHLRAVFQSQSTSFRVNASYGFILRHRLKGTLRYYHSSVNNARLFDDPPRIENEKDFENFLERLDQSDVVEWAKQQVNHLPEHPIGRYQDLPDWLKHRKGVLTRCESDTDDGLCFFRALAVHKDPALRQRLKTRERPHLQRQAKEHFKSWASNKAIDQPFRGVLLSDLEDLEQHFEVNLMIYRLEQRHGAVIAVLERRSAGLFPSTMTLNLWNDHFSYIPDMKKYAQSYACAVCGQRWKDSWSCLRHQDTCGADQKHIYVGGVYRPSPTVFEAMERLGVCVPKALRFYPYRATFDFESLLEKTDSPDRDTRHVPVSFSVSSNMPGFGEPRCVVSDGDPKTLVLRFVEMLEEIALVASGLLHETHGCYLQDLKEKAEKERRKEEEAWGELSFRKNQAEELVIKMKMWMNQLVCLGFNSGKYDLNLMKTYLVQLFKADGRTLQTENGEGTQDTDDPRRILYVVKKSNAYMCFVTPTLKLLDITMFMAPGCSYSKYLKAYDVPENKGYFPYEFLDVIERLDDPQLPPYEAFYSNLKEVNVLDEGGGEQAGRKRHQELVELWKRKDMKTFRDYLIHYNNLDTAPFLVALERHAAFFKDQGMDMFKEAISLPSLALKMSFQGVEAEFFRFGSRYARLDDLVREQVVGGPSLIFHRYHEAGKTFLRQNEYGEEARLCRKVIGLDASALYLHCFAQPMPTGQVVYRESPDFRRKSTQKSYSTQAIDWLRWVEECEGRVLAHAGNGSEVRLGTKRIPVDGFDADAGVVFQFQGCYYHGCQHCFKPDLPHPYHPGKTMADVREKTAEIIVYLSSCGYEVREMWECQWSIAVEKDERIREFLGDRKPTSSLKASPEEGEILEQVKTDNLFGMVLVDILTPQHLKHRFRELPPIFKNTSIGREDIGEFMRAFAEANDVLSKPTRMLISSYHAQKILLTTPLLRWYLLNGLTVTKVHALLEFRPEACFQPMADRVSEARRLGDRDPRYAIMGQNYKLLGNACYGKAIENKGRFVDVHYTDVVGASRLVNSNRFRSLTTLDGEDLFEVLVAKAKVVHDLPHHIAFFVYQYAKLRMLELRYDFLDRFFDDRDFQLIEMDTDSSYMGISTESLDEAVKPDMKSAYYAEYNRWFPSEACQAHLDDFVRVKMGGEVWQPAECCRAQKLHDIRTPGLFKVEWEGRGMVALCSKTYCCFGEEGEQVKISSKGLQKKKE